MADLRTPPVRDGVDLFWLPLGAGGHCVHWNGRAYEALAALAERRAARPLFHSALVVALAGRTWAVEMTPVWEVDAPERGVVAEGAVGAAWAGRWRLFRYEVHCWPDGSIGEVAYAVGGAVRLTEDATACERLLAVLPEVPRPVWGRDELRTGEMWNSNSVTSWALVSAGLDLTGVRPPRDGRAPGWDAGLVVAARSAGSAAAGLPSSAGGCDSWRVEHAAPGDQRQRCS